MKIYLNTYYLALVVYMTAILSAIFNLCHKTNKTTSDVPLIITLKIKLSPYMSSSQKPSQSLDLFFNIFKTCQFLRYILLWTTQTLIPNQLY